MLQRIDRYYSKEQPNAIVLILQQRCIDCCFFEMGNRRSYCIQNFCSSSVIDRLCYCQGMGATAKILSKPATFCAASSKSSQLNSNASRTPRCAVISAVAPLMAGESKRLVCKRRTISPNDKSNFPAKYRPINSTPNGKFPTQPHSAAPRSCSDRNLSIPINDSNSSNAAPSFLGIRSELMPSPLPSHPTYYSHPHKTCREQSCSKAMMPQS